MGKEVYTVIARTDSCGIVLVETFESKSEALLFERDGVLPYLCENYSDRMANDESLSISFHLRDIHKSAMTQYQEKVINNLNEYIESLETDNRELKNEVVLHRGKAEGDYWAWQGDGEDYMESMVSSLPVVIYAKDLRKLVRGNVPATSVYAEATKVALSKDGEYVLDVTDAYDRAMDGV